MTTYHCKRCSHTTRSLPAMAEHVREEHPHAMDRKGAKKGYAHLDAKAAQAEYNREFTELVWKYHDFDRAEAEMRRRYP